MFTPVPILQIGISTNRVTALAISGLNRPVVFEVTKKDFICGCVFVAFSKVPWLADFEWQTTSYFPSNDTFKCTLHTLQYANIAPLSLAHIKSIWVAHSGWYFAAYFFFFAELAHDESDAHLAILSSFQSNAPPLTGEQYRKMQWNINVHNKLSYHYNYIYCPKTNSQKY